MSAFLTFFYNLFAAIMAPSLFSWGASKPAEIEAPPKLSAEEQEAQDTQERETFQKAVREALNNEDFTKAVVCNFSENLISLTMPFNVSVSSRSFFPETWKKYSQTQESFSIGQY